MTRFVIVFLAVFLFGHADTDTQKIKAIACTFSDQTGCKPCFRPTSDENNKVENKWPDVTDLELDRIELRLPPPKEGKAGSPPAYPDYSQEMTLKVKTTSSDPEGDILTHSYTISGGRVVGTGANVTWDLNGVMPGTYTITAAVDDGCGLCGARVTKTVTVVQDNRHGDIECAIVALSPPTASDKDRLYDFVSKVSLGTYDIKEYIWTVTNAEILEGQGTPSAKIRAPKDASGPEPTVTINIVGDVDKAIADIVNASCPGTETFTIPKEWYRPR